MIDAVGKKDSKICKTYVQRALAAVVDSGSISLLAAGVAVLEAPAGSEFAQTMAALAREAEAAQATYTATCPTV